ncbi:MAG: co-chaperone GroES [Gemmatimonadetes bacterium]|nr:co-chaperone GroES [Gemmatimonadota bacterium]MYH52688.1 co-chaperone GroES [Gemmatimonadota bacterium]MYK65552.1 co-chaperone GroES [Gemmatimonadota bacterium]
MEGKSGKQLIVVGDRVLIEPEEGEERTTVGLYLPASAVDKQSVQGGRVLATGPGTPIGAPTELDEEPWKIGSGEARYLPVQARVGDFAIFFRKAAVEISFEGTEYLVVPLAAILTLVRDGEKGSEPVFQL